MNNHQIENSHYYTLLQEYVDLCNQVLERHKNSFPFGQMWQAIEKKCHNQMVNIAVIDDKPNALCGLTVSEKGISVLPQKDNPVKSDCHIKLSHIKNVLDNKEIYIQDPTKIDWHWIEVMVENYKSSQG